MTRPRHQPIYCFSPNQKKRGEREREREILLAIRYFCDTACDIYHTNEESTTTVKERRGEVLVCVYQRERNPVPIPTYTAWDLPVWYGDNITETRSKTGVLPRNRNTVLFFRALPHVTNKLRTVGSSCFPMGMRSPSILLDKFRRGIKSGSNSQASRQRGLQSIQIGRESRFVLQQQHISFSARPEREIDTEIPANARTHSISRVLLKPL